MNNNFNNDDQNLTKLYNSVFNNRYLKNIIFNHLNKFNILSVNIQFFSVDEFKEFKYKRYLNNVTLDFRKYYDLNELPENIKHITIRPPSQIKDQEFEIISVPNHIESVSYTSPIGFSLLESLKKQPHSSNIKKLGIYLINSIKELPKNAIPESVTELEITNDGSTLPNNLLPKSLKKLTIYDLRSFEDGIFQIESLNYIYIQTLSISIVNRLSKINNINLVKLELNCSNTFVTNLVTFPDTLEELIVFCNTFDGKLPANLKSFQLNIKNYKNPILLPSSLESFSIFQNKKAQEAFQNNQKLPPNLKFLELECSSITNNNGESILPDKLENLVINVCSSFNQVLQVNQLPSSLTHLDLGASFNQVIDVNVLPPNLETLVLGFDYSQEINPLAIPQNLKSLQIGSQEYNLPINLTPSTHPNTVISTYDDSTNCYYQASSTDYTEIRLLRLSDNFESPFSTLQLQNKSNLEYLHLGYHFNHPIELSDLPTQNNIKTLELSNEFSQTINLEYFQNLETIVIQDDNSNPSIITTTIINDQKHVHYNNYKLKNIIVSPKCNQHFFKQLDANFYQFLKYKNK